MIKDGEKRGREHRKKDKKTKGRKHRKKDQKHLIRDKKTERERD